MRRFVKIDHRFALLLACAAVAAFAFRALHLPGAWLFGPLAVSSFFAVRGWQAAKFPNAAYLAAQAVIGTALGGGFSAGTLSVLPQHFGIFLFAVVFILLASLGNGWLLARFTTLDAGTAFLGTMPGGASSMAAMSDSLHADTRLVTTIQYARLLVILATLAVAGTLLDHHDAGGPSPFAAAGTFVAWKFGVLVLLAITGWLAGTYTKIPAGTFLVPTVLYCVLNGFGIAADKWPWPILATAYMIMGLQIGGRFHPSTITIIRGVLLPVIGTTLLLLTA